MMKEVDLSDRYAGSRIKQMAASLSGDGDGIGKIMEWLLHSTDKRVRMNAAWILNNLCKEDRLRYLAPYRDALADLAMSALPFRRQMVLALLLDFPTEDSPRIDLLDYCLEHLHDEKEGDSSRAFMIYLAAKMCRPYPELHAELMHTLDMLPPTLPPSIACARRKVYAGSVKKDNEE